MLLCMKTTMAYRFRLIFVNLWHGMVVSLVRKGLSDCKAGHVSLMEVYETWAGESNGDEGCEGNYKDRGDYKVRCDRSTKLHVK